MSEFIKTVTVTHANYKAVAAREDVDYTEEELLDALSKYTGSQTPTVIIPVPTLKKQMGW